MILIVNNNDNYNNVNDSNKNIIIIIIIIIINWLLRNPEVHYRSYISPPLIPILSKVHPVPSITTHLLHIHFNINLPPSSRSP